MKTGVVRSITSLKKNSDMAKPDRTIQPALMPVTIGTLPEPELIRLDNGIPLFIINSGTEDIMKIDFHFDAGTIFEKTPLAASTVNMMLFEGSENLSAAEINKQLDFYGTQPSNYIEKDNAGVTLMFLNKHIEKVLALCNEIVFLPLFPEDELTALMRKRLQWYLVNREKVSTLAADRLGEIVFGKGHPYGRAVRQEDYAGIGREMLQQFHSLYYQPNGMTVFASGKIESNSVSLINKHFGTISLRGRVETTPPPLEEKDACYNDRIIKKGAIQSAIRIGSRTISKRHPDYFGLKILDTILGGYFGSRLMKNIREEKGYTYGIHSSIRSYRLSGYKSISAEVGSDHTSEATEEIYKEISILQNERVKEAELDAVKNYMLGELLRMFDGPFATLDSFRSAWEFGMDNTYYIRFAETIKSIDSDEIMSLACTYYKTEDLIEVTAGPE